MLTVKINTDNAAFHLGDSFDNKLWNSRIECADLLREIADKLMAETYSGPVLDHNGNKVGEFKLTSR